MAYEMNIRGTQDKVKIRSPWAAALLPIITLGIYHLVWWYRINREMSDYGKAKGFDLGQNPTNSVLALFPGGLIIVPALITYWRGTKRVQGASSIAGQEPLNGWIAIILYLIISPGLWAYIQVELNKVWEAEADPIPEGSCLHRRRTRLHRRLNSSRSSRRPRSRPPSRPRPSRPRLSRRQAQVPSTRCRARRQLTEAALPVRRRQLNPAALKTAPAASRSDERAWARSDLAAPMTRRALGQATRWARTPPPQSRQNRSSAADAGLGAAGAAPEAGPPPADTAGGAFGPSGCGSSGSFSGGGSG